jgi:hypothetical protein
MVTLAPISATCRSFPRLSDDRNNCELRNLSDSGIFAKFRGRSSYRANQSCSHGRSLQSWAHGVLKVKDTLTVADAKQVEAAFQEKLASIGSDDIDRVAIQKSEERSTNLNRAKKRRRVSVVNKIVLALPTPRRIRDREHVKSVAKLACLIRGVQRMPTISDLPSRRHSADDCQRSRVLAKNPSVVTNSLIG